MARKYKMDKNLTIKNNSKSRRGFLQDITKWIGGTAFLAAAANILTSSKIKADSTSVNDADPLLGEIMLVGFNFAPRGWAFCDGQILPISQNQSLYSLLGTTYGGDGRTTFALPDLRGRVSIGPDQGPGLPNYSWGQSGGSNTITLTEAQLPQHNHALNVKSDMGNNDNPSGQYLASNSEGIKHYSDSAGAAASNGSIGNSGGSQAHNNMQPYLGIYHCIAMQGVFPSRN
jgi:microcystin-dependent protein